MWARDSVYTLQCPKSIITVQSLEWIDQFNIWKTLGCGNPLNLNAKSADAIALLDVEKTKNNSPLSKKLLGAGNGSRGKSAGSTPPAIKESQPAGTGIEPQPTSIDFGKEPKAASQSSTESSSNELTGFVENTLTHGLTSTASNLFGSSASLSSSGLGVVGSIISGLAGLFGGSKPQPAPLPSFSLPGSEIQSISIHGQDSTVANTENANASYGRLPDAATGQEYIADQQQQIAQAVKTALLQSHSLSDVISEL